MKPYINPEKDYNKLIDFMFKSNLINNGAFIYELFSYNNYLKDILNSTDDKPVKCNVNDNIVVSSEEQVICLLNRMINRFDKHFPFLHRCRKSLFIDFLGYDETKKFLLSKHYLGDNKYIDFFEDSINRIFVRNFYRNLQYTKDDYIDIFKERKINYKNLSLDKTTHLYKLVNLLSDFTYCQHNSYHINYLFDSIEDRINYHSKAIGRKKTPKEVWEERIISHHRIHTEEIIKAYNRKKAYLELFKK